jgi:predicted nucleotidyltransferase
MTTQELLKVNLESLRQLLSTNFSIDAAALYGSVARGDIESHSDVDLLLVCRDSRKLSAFLAVQKTLKGCFKRLSLTVYSERELKFLHSVNSLFLLHLSREAIVLFDKNDFLNLLLSNFQPKDSYHLDFQQSLRLMDPLTTVIEAAPNNLHRLSYIYSLFRVFGVYLLAENKIYEFSKSRMVRSLIERFPHQQWSVELLSMLRVLNSNFFTGGIATGSKEQTGRSVLKEASALASLTGVEMDVVPVPYEGAVGSFDEALGERTRGLDYRLRMWFLLLVYDGLNLYRSKVGSEPLTSLSEPALREFVGSENPQPISHAAEETIRYLHRYPLKYFLSDESRISAQTARSILYGLSYELARH